VHREGQGLVEVLGFVKSCFDHGAVAGGGLEAGRLAARNGYGRLFR